jgi:hypothetical protein
VGVLMYYLRYLCLFSDSGVQHLYLQLFVGVFMYYLRYLCLFSDSGVQHLYNNTWTLPQTTGGISVGHHCLKTNTNNVNNTWTLPQTTGGISVGHHCLKTNTNNVNNTAIEYVELIYWKNESEIKCTSLYLQLFVGVLMYYLRYLCLFSDSGGLSYFEIDIIKFI